MMKLDLFDQIMPVARITTQIQKTGLWGKLKPFYEEAASLCREACPLGTDIPLFMYYLKEGDLQKAKEAILFENPFPGISGRVCSCPCEEACARRELDFPVSIRAVERFLGDYPFFSTLSLENKNPKNIAVVGSGPAGLSCAYFLLRLGHKVTIFEKENKVGGLLYFAIPSYRLPKDVLQRELKSVLNLNPQLKLNSELRENDLLALFELYDYVFLAFGLWSPKKLAVKGINLNGVYYGLEFLTKVKSLQEPIRRAIVIGGGDVAMDAARTIRRLKPEAKVSVFAPEKRDDLFALKENVEETEEEGIDIACGYLPILFKGNEKIEKVVFQATSVKKDEKTGDLLFIPLHEKREEVADIVIICVGQKAQPLSKIKEIIDERGFVVVDERGRTRIKKVYAGGDITGEKPSYSNAIASGKKAAICIDMDAKGLEVPLEELTIGTGRSLSFKKYLGLEKKNTKKVVTFSDLNTIPFERIPRTEIKKENPFERTKDFREVLRTFTELEAKNESERCLSCGQCRRCDLCFYLCPDISIFKKLEGTYEVDYNYCKSCGICVKTCPSHVIELLERDGGAFIR